jgi:acetoin:2,6-dichlorophenolindophenol oxidoreductase subunit alpha
VQDPQLATNSGFVEPLEAPPDHLRRGAVAECARGAETEDRASVRPGRVERAQLERSGLDVVARGQLGLCIEVAPVGRQARVSGVPGVDEARALVVLQLRNFREARELELALDALGVEPAQQRLDVVRGDTCAAASGCEVDRPPPTAGIRRSEQRSRSRRVLLVADVQTQAGRLPVVRKGGHELPKLLDQAQALGLPAAGKPALEVLDEAHCAERTITPVAKVEQRRGVSEEVLREFFREMLLIRRFEEKVEERFRAGELPGFLHVAIGQEAVAVGVCRALADGDVIASTHRAHGHTLAKGTHPNELMAELYGKVEGCSHGYGGSMHLYDVERGNLGANAVVGGGLPAIVGAALAFQLRGEPRVAVAFFGDGATNIGTFHESLNLAQLWGVPAVFVCEDNHWAESTPEGQHSPIQDLSKRAEAFGMKSMKVDGQDVEEVNKVAARALKHARDGKGPVFLLCETERLVGHYIGDPQVYRDKDELHRLQETADPITLLRGKLGLSDEEFEALDREVQDLVDASVEFAKGGTDPKPEDALKNVYA